MYNPASLVKDAKDLIDSLGLKDVVIGGWSFGGIVAQIYVAMFGPSVTHAVLIAGTPPGPPPNPVFPSDDVLKALKHTNVPILHLNGDRDISFPVENWYALNGQFPTLSLITYPRAGHAAHFQYPELAAAHIAAFIKDTKKA